MSSLKNKSAVITGGLTGQGLAIAHALAKMGANVAVGSFVGEAAARQGDAAAYPESSELRSIRESLLSHDVKVFAGHIDVRDTQVIKAFLAEAEKQCGKADILVNSAGTTAEHPVSGHPDDLWLKIIDTNLNGAFRMARELLPGMIERGFGRVINIGSTAASVGWKDNPAYCASKSGLLGLTRCIALEGAAHGVTCVMVSPTWVETEMMRRDVAQIAIREGRGRTTEEVMAEFAQQNPQQRLIQAEEIASLTAFLCTDEAKGINMENIQITGGALW